VLASPADLRIVFGVGNPGDEYVGTRHNLGFEVVDTLAHTAGRALKRLLGLEARGVLVEIAGRPVQLVQPLTYVNRCGPVLARLRDRDGLHEDRLLVVVDDVWLEPGRLRLRAGGSDGGHNGLRSLQGNLGTDRFPRLRVGIGPAPDGVPLEAHVLSPVDPAAIASVRARAAEVVSVWAESGLERAQQVANG